ncbi:secreted protein containing Fibrinogen, alpha/beta/gamma chain [Candidatus Magnetomorum sp. HK-1]|nr:secreted protein containing Fibrinogen, alpha/beta/gamma chain [Candidatus Magnetomorum sp. HK-1]
MFTIKRFTHYIFKIFIIYLLSAFLCSCGGGGANDELSFQYGVKTIEGSDGVELRLYYGENNFLTMTNHNGVLEIVPHPGTDKTNSDNIWVAQPYMPDAILGHTSTTTPLIYADYINIKTIGAVSHAANQSFGLWSMDLDFSYDPELHEISATGKYGISFTEELPSNKMYLGKIKSQYLSDVVLIPLKHQNPGQTTKGNTGWMEKLIAITPVEKKIWVPDQESSFTHNYYKGDLLLNLIGNFFHPDTAAYNLAPMESSYKSSMILNIHPEDNALEIAYAFNYDLDKQQEISSPNVLITPFIHLNTSQINFTIEFTSRSVEYKDGSSPENAGQSCDQILQNNLSIGNSIYWVDLDENNSSQPIQVFCDMTDNDGGWMLYASINQPADIEQIIANYYSKGYQTPNLWDVNTGNWIQPAYIFESYISTMRLNMGEITDFFKPGSSYSFEDMLTSNKHHEWSYSSTGPFIKPNYSSKGLGGSDHSWPLNNIQNDNRLTLSFWGSNTGAGSGGCCSLSNSAAEYAWGKPFKLWIR